MPTRRKASFAIIALSIVCLGISPRGYCGERGSVPRQALARIEEATVFIECRYVRLKDMGRDDLTENDIALTTSGTGFLLASDGLIITNAHVVSLAETYDIDPEDNTDRAKWAARYRFALHSVTVWRNSGTRNAKKYDAKILCTRPFPLDIALIRIESDKPLPEPPAMDSIRRLDIRREAFKTQRVWAVGFPLGRRMERALSSMGMTRNPNGPDISIREGSISSIRHNNDGVVKAIEHTCPIQHGNSGGPLINSDGNIMGINSFGIPGKDDGTGQAAYFAIPLDIILNEFTATLQMVRYRGLFESADLPRRTIHIDPDASDHDEPHEHDGHGKVCMAAKNGATFKTIKHAFDDAHRGDTIRLAAGEYALFKKLEIPAGIRFIGAGIDRTVLKQVGQFSPVVAVGAADAFEISHLTLKAKGFSTAMVVLTGAKGETYLHDLRIEAENGWGLKIGGSADIVNCRIENDYMQMDLGPSYLPSLDQAIKVIANGPVRIEGTHCDGYIVVIDSQAIVTGSSGAGIVYYGSDAKGAVHGCRFGNVVITEGATAAVKDNLILGNRSEPMGGYCMVRSGAEAIFAGNHIDTFGWLLVTGQDTKAQITGNYFKNVGIALGASNGASVEMHDNTVMFAGKFPIRPVPIGQKNESCFGISAFGSGTTVAYSGNLFESTHDGQPFRQKDGAAIKDEGANTVKIH